MPPAMEGNKVHRKKSIMYISLSDEEHSGDETDNNMAVSTTDTSSSDCIATSESETESRDHTRLTRNLENFSHNSANNASRIVYDEPPMRLPKQGVLKTRRMSAGMADAPQEYPRRKSSMRRTRKYSDFTLYKTFSQEMQREGELENTLTPESADHNAIHELSASTEEALAKQDNEHFLVNSAANLKISE